MTASTFPIGAIAATSIGLTGAIFLPHERLSYGFLLMSVSGVLVLFIFFFAFTISPIYLSDFVREDLLNFFMIGNPGDRTGQRVWIDNVRASNDELVDAIRNSGAEACSHHALTAKASSPSPSSSRVTGFRLPIIRRMQIAVARTQKTTLVEQVRVGIRCFDIRFSRPGPGGPIEVDHGVVFTSMQEALDQIRAAAAETSDTLEVIIRVSRFDGSGLTTDELTTALNMSMPANVLFEVKNDQDVTHKPTTSGSVMVETLRQNPEARDVSVVVHPSPEVVVLFVFILVTGTSIMALVMYRGTRAARKRIHPKEAQAGDEKKREPLLPVVTKKAGKK